MQSMVMKRHGLFILFCIFTLSTAVRVYGQNTGEKLVAILEVVDQTGKLDPSIKMMVRGGLTTAITNTPGYEGYDRATMSSIMGEQNFQRTGNVSSEQIKKLGEMTGADYVLIAEAMKTFDGKLYITTKIVNVETAKITESAENLAPLESEAIRNACKELATQLLKVKGISQPIKKINPEAEKNQDYVENTWGLNMKMVFVEGGSFVMGCTEEQGDCSGTYTRIRHNVNLHSFYIGETEVTQSQWQKVMGTSISQQKNKAAENALSYLTGEGPEYPIYYVSWDDAMRFCEELSRQTGKTYTLPTEAQWEYAARGGIKNDKTMYSGGNVLEALGWYKENSSNTSHPVKQKRANSLGIYDMSGNVYEWCSDWAATDYNINEVDNPVGPRMGDQRILRGGRWNGDAERCRTSRRTCDSPTSRYFGVGFRVVMIP